MTIVVGYVPKPEGRAALVAALEEADLRGESLHVLNTSKGDAYSDPGYASQDDLAEVKALLDESGVPYELEHRLGDQAGGAADILEAVERLGASLVVIGIRKRTPTGKLLFGSDAQTVLLHAPCQVLAVKAG
ncbi:Nucleotide-binding universal stress protein, UspA family [Quadrisphaera granulorum]|uniref:Nucleotide-binding universal stress UspA family protein n=1 Tax=Quadrisphaera granulorum TaxID=317664 RepID=A0A316ADN7_9ACTN|nr:universal stress protein [Quadrisphaera granulorum]PWJ55378.1 nucleotide-binding universal stress UspA family protein [Quadrisphaera granulorum]SZE95442.1 Nucleotide-binding universal stress protein, UspA family [Quadrisphaera granulorum]